MTYSKNDILEVKIEDIGVNGEGIGKVDGYTLFVKDAIVSDYVRVKIRLQKHMHMRDWWRCLRHLHFVYHLSAQ